MKKYFIRSLMAQVLSLILLTQTVQASQCSFLVQRVMQEQMDQNIEIGGSILKDSYLSLGINSTAWIAGAHFAKSGGNFASFSDPAFLLVWPLDVSLSYLSHTVSNVPDSQLGWLKKVLSAKGGLKNYFKRVGANTAISGTVIQAFWGPIAQAMGMKAISFSAVKLSAAMSLTFTVYAILQVTRPLLFKKIPGWIAKKQFARLRTLLPQLADQANHLLKNPDLLKVDPEEFQKLFFRSLDSLTFDEAWEAKALPLDLGQLRAMDSRMRSPIQNKYVEKTEAFLKAIAKAKKPQKIKELRKEYVYWLVKNFDEFSTQKFTSSFGKEISQQEAILKYLRFDDSLSAADTLVMLKEMHRAQKQQFYMLGAATFVDQGIAVGFAGGIALNLLTKWAQETDDPDYNDLFHWLKTGEMVEDGVPITLAK